MPNTIRWPLAALPIATTAGRFPLDDNAHRTTYRSHQTHALHLHDYPATLRMSTHTFTLSPGDITLTPVHIPSSYALPHPGHHWCIHFRPAKKSRRQNAIHLPLHLPLGPHAAFATERFRRIATLFAQTRAEPANQLAATSVSLLTQELLLWLADLHHIRTESRTTPQKIDHALDKLIAILQARFTENLSVPALADQLELSQNYLARRFRERFRTTIPHYLVARRIEHACYLLTATDMPIHRVGQRVGMPDAQHFNKQFRRVTNQSPSAFRAATRKDSPR
jgi:AraC-like DNA-binding protein